MSTISRCRDFLAAATAALGAGNALAYPATETINIGCIGTGGRCRRLMGTLKGLPGVMITAVCDIWDESLNHAKELLAPRHLQPRTITNCSPAAMTMLCSLVPPDHWHVPMTVHACESGQDVYVEKPLTHDLREGESVVRAQDENRRIVQVGTRQRSMPQQQTTAVRPELTPVKPTHNSLPSQTPKFQSFRGTLCSHNAVVLVRGKLLVIK